MEIIYIAASRRNFNTLFREFPEIFVLTYTVLIEHWRYGTELVNLDAFDVFKNLHFVLPLDNFILTSLHITHEFTIFILHITTLPHYHIRLLISLPNYGKNHSGTKFILEPFVGNVKCLRENLKMKGHFLPQTGKNQGNGVKKPTNPLLH